MDVKNKILLVVASIVCATMRAEFVQAGCVDDSEPGFTFISCTVRTTNKFTVNVSNRTVVLSWEAYKARFKETRHEKYTLQQTLNNTNSVINAAPSLTGSHTVNLVNDGTYSFCHEAKGSQGDRTNTSNTMVPVTRQVCRAVAVTSVPASITAPGTANSHFTVSWSSSVAATRYELQLRKDNGSWQAIYSGSATSYLQSSLGNGLYQYRIRACSANMCSAYKLSGETVVARVPAIPSTSSFLPASLACGDNVTLSWGASADANRYQVLQRQRLSGGAWSQWLSLASEHTLLSYSLLNLASGYDYQYAIRAQYVQGTNQSAWSDYLYSNSIRKPYCQAGTPANLRVSTATALTTENYQVSWNVANGVVHGYELQEKFNNAAWVTVQNSAELNQHFTLRARGRYCYRVRANNADTQSPYTVQQCVDIKYPLPVIELTVSGAVSVGGESYNSGWSGIYSLSWNVSGEQLNSATLQANGVAQTILTTLNSSQAYDQPDNMGVSDNQYTYQINACNADGCSTSSLIKVIVKAYPIPTPPGNFQNNSDVSDNKQYSLNWTAPQEPTTWYVLERGVQRVQLAGTVLSYTYTGEYGQSYSHQIKACFNDVQTAHCSAYTVAKSVYIRYPVPTIPGVIRVTAGPDPKGEVSLAWDAASGFIDSYQLQQRWKNGSWNDVQNSAALSATFKLAKDGVNAFRVRACNVDRCSAYSALTSTTVEFTRWSDSGGVVANKSLPNTIVADSDFNGAVPGQAQVNGGSAVYSIPIELPPGRNGFQPHVSLDYSSRAGNGVMGVGWSLSAISSVSECRSTYAQDGPSSGDDKLCLNGQRLMLTSGVYGLTGATYRTELDNLIVVTQGENGTKRFFKAEHPDGSVSYYGNVIDVNADLSDERRWYLERVQSANGKNTIDYQYEHQRDSKNALIGELLLRHIIYTGSDTGLGNRKVTFNYQARTDVSTRHSRAGKTRQTKRLASIQTFYDNQKLREYTLDYGALSPASKRSLLRRVSACAFKGLETLCQAPTTFEWNDDATHYQVELLTDSLGAELHPGPTASLKDQLPHGDRNGDGVKDWPGFFVNAEGVSTRHNLDLINCSYNRHNFSRQCTEGDFNQDGRTDSWRVVNGMLQIGYTSATGIDWSGITNVTMDAMVSGSTIPSNDFLYYISDFNGDGWPDILVHRFNNRKPKIYLHLHTKNVLAPYSVANEQLLFSYITDGGGCGNDLGFGVCATKNDLQPMGDLDGNGLTDFAVLSRNKKLVNTHMLIKAVKLTKRALDGSVYFSDLNFDFGQFGFRANFSTFVDINNDNLPDWLGWFKNSTQLHLRINKGNGVFGEVTPLGVSLASKSLIINGDVVNELDREIIIPKFSLLPMDVDGDGRNELIVPGAIEVEGCHTVNHRNVDEWRCGSALYGSREQKVGGIYVRASIAPEDDTNIYRYNALHFVEDNDGNFTAQYRPTNFVAGANNVAVIDAFGNGLQDLVFNYGCENLNCKMNTPVAGSVLSGKAEGVYFNRNYGSTSDTAPSAADYRPRDMILKVNDTVARESRWSYLPLSSGQVDNFYQTDHNYVDDDAHFHFNSSMYVVSQFDQSNGVGGYNRTRYRYRGAVYNALGRGFAGFRGISVFDDSNALVTDTVFRQKFPFTGRELKIHVYTQEQFSLTNPKPLSISRYDWAINTAHKTTYGHQKLVQVYNTRSETYNYDLIDHSQLDHTVVEIPANGIDTFGNVTQKTTQIDDSFGTYITEDSTVFDATLSWPHKYTQSTLTKKSVTHKLGPVPAIDTNTDKVITTKVDAWDLIHRQPKQVSVYASTVNNGEGVTTITTFNDYGLPTRVQSQGKVFNDLGVSTVQTRYIETDYSTNGETLAADGYFPFALGQQASASVIHKTAIKTDPRTGKSTQTVDKAGIVVSTQYDALGRVLQVDRTGIPSSYTRYRTVDANAPINAIMRVQTVQAGTPTNAIYLDKMDRTLRTITQGFAGETVFQDVVYNERGLKTHETNLYTDHLDISTTVYSEHDALGRPGVKTSPQTNGTMTTHYLYKGLTTDIQTLATVGHNLLMSRSYNSLDQLVKTVDAKGGVTTYAYDGAGNPIVIKDVAGNAIYTRYDHQGRKQWVDDPNQGKTHFIYNAFDELEKQTDANGAVIHFDRDLLGRVITRRADGSEAQFVWDTVKPGLLTSETENGASKTYSYDHAARITHTTVNLEGNIYITQTQYDANFGRPKALVYPNQLTLAYDYNQYGYLTHEKNAASGYVYREITAQDARGNITATNIGSAEGSVFTVTGSYRYSPKTGQMLSSVVSNGKADLHDLRYQTSGYDSYGNILLQQNLSQWVNADGIADPTVNFDASETFVYDELHRLVSSRLSAGNTIKTVNYGYDAVGNLLKKDDYASSYHYDGTGTAGPNAVTSITLLNNTVVNFTYDNKGNQTHRNGVQHVNYTVYNKPASITKNAVQFSFKYGADLARFKQVRTVAGKTTTTWSIGKHYEVEQVTGSVDKILKAYIGDVAIISVDGPNKKRIRFTHRDRLGSTATFTDHNASVVARRGFDPFGAPRIGDWRPLDIPRLANNPVDVDRVTRRGFTDHEHLDEAELIHMNGRVFDYNLGRFLSVDPVIQSPGNSQSINPYSYIMNNPLAGIDPTGYVGTDPGAGGKRDVEKQVTKEKKKGGHKRIQGVGQHWKVAYQSGSGSKKSNGAQTGQEEGGAEDFTEINSLWDTNGSSVENGSFEDKPSKDLIQLAGRVPGDLGADVAGFVLQGLGVYTDEQRHQAQGERPGRKGKKSKQKARLSDVATKGAKGLETRGVKPAPGERTIQGQVDAATQAGNPTVQRGGQDLFRLRSSGHGQTGATATPQNVRNVTPDGRAFTGKGPDRAVTPRDIRELHKAQTGQGTSTIRTRSGR